MMGRKARTFGPLPPLTLEELVPADHFYRHLERSLDLSFVRDLVSPTYADRGRPSIDPVVFFKLQVGFPSRTELATIIERTTEASAPVVQKVISAADVLALRDLVREVVDLLRVFDWIADITNLLAVRAQAPSQTPRRS